MFRIGREILVEKTFPRDERNTLSLLLFVETKFFTGPNQLRGFANFIVAMHQPLALCSSTENNEREFFLVANGLPL